MKTADPQLDRTTDGFIIERVSCPACGQPEGQKCVFIPRAREVAHHSPRPKIHKERRTNYVAWINILGHFGLLEDGDFQSDSGTP